MGHSRLESVRLKADTQAPMMGLHRGVDLMLVGCNDTQHLYVVDIQQSGQRNSVWHDPIRGVCAERSGCSSKVVEGLGADFLEDVLSLQNLVVRSTSAEALGSDALKKIVRFSPAPTIGSHCNQLIQRAAG